MSTTLNPASSPLFFNPLKFAHRLRDAGVPDQQAETLHEALAGQTQAVSLLEEQIKTLTADTKRNTEHMATKGDIALLKSELESKIILVRRDTITWLGSMLVAGFGSVILLLLRMKG